MRVAIHDGTTIKNVIVVDSLDGFDPGDGLQVEPLDDASPLGPGWQRLSNGWTAPEPGPPPAPTDAEQIAALKARLADTQAALDEVIIGALMGEFPPS